MKTLRLYLFLWYSSKLRFPKDYLFTEPNQFYFITNQKKLILFFFFIREKKNKKFTPKNGAYPSCGYSTNKPKKWVPQNSPPKVNIVDDFDSIEAIRKINQDTFGPCLLNEKRLVTTCEYDKILRQHRLECRKIILEHEKCKHPQEWSSRLLEKARDKN